VSFIMTRNKTNLAISILSITAALMLAAHWLAPTSATAQVAIKERDYQVVTARVQTGGDGLYILDNRTGQIAVFTYDPASRAVRARTVRMVADAVTQGR
jgi:hypothetical protein